MGIAVNSTFADYAEYEDATGWVVDDNGRLHVTKTGVGNVATFNTTQWLSVVRIVEDAECCGENASCSACA